MSHSYKGHHYSKCTKRYRTARSWRFRHTCFWLPHNNGFVTLYRYQTWPVAVPAVQSCCRSSATSLHQSKALSGIKRRPLHDLSAKQCHVSCDVNASYFLQTLNVHAHDACICTYRSSTECQPALWWDICVYFHTWLWAVPFDWTAFLEKQVQKDSLLQLADHSVAVHSPLRLLQWQICTCHKIHISQSHGSCWRRKQKKKKKKRVHA